MNNILTLPARNLNTTGSQPPGKKLILHYSIDNKVVCQAEFQLTANTRFIEIPLPVIHQMTRGSMK